MAYDKVIDSAKLDADLTTVADAIRSKGGTSEALAFPSGFVSAIESIEVGTGGGSEPSLQYLEVTPARAAHIYEPDEGYDGFSEVKVTGDGDLLPENIVSGVTIFGVIGTAKTGSGETAKTTAIDYSNYASGTFTETLDTGEDITYNVTLDSEGKPTSIATPNGDTVTVEW